MITGPPALSGVRRAIKQSLFAMGYYGRRLSHVAFPGVAVLCYHGIRRADEATPFNELHVTRDTFERHCELLAKSCNPISLDDFRAARAGTRRLPPRAVMVTFDETTAIAACSTTGCRPSSATACQRSSLRVPVPSLGRAISGSTPCGAVKAKRPC